MTQPLLGHVDPSAVDADIFVVGHHGSKTSTRTGLLDAVTPKISIVSSGPTKYSGTSLPDSDVLDKLAVAGEVLKTLSRDANENPCRTKADKIGNDDDGKPGGCDNIQLTLTSAGPAGQVTTEIFSGPD